MRQDCSRRKTLSLTRLDDRINPAQIHVWDTAWNAATPGTLPYAIALANNQATHNGQDEIIFDFGANPLFGQTPTFNVGSTLAVKEGVIIRAGGGLQYVTFTGTRPFDFTHEDGAAGAGKQSEIKGGVFDKCIVAPNAAVPEGGAIRVTGGQLTTLNTRFTENSAKHGGAVFVGSQGTLVVDGLPGVGAPDPTNHIEQQGREITLFKKNSASLDGGAMEVAGKVVLKRGWFVDNKASQDGGAIDVYGNGEVDTAQIQVGGVMVNADVSFLRNDALRNGGGLHFNSTATSTLVGVKVGANTAVANGGGVWVGNGTVDLTDAYVALNSAAAGGGVYVGGGTMNATTVTFEDNIAPLGPDVRQVAPGVFNDTNCIYL